MWLTRSGAASAASVASNPPPECPTRTAPGLIAETIASRRLANVDSSSTRAPCPGRSTATASWPSASSSPIVCVPAPCAVKAAVHEDESHRCYLSTRTGTWDQPATFCIATRLQSSQRTS